MSDNIDLTKILKDVPKGTKLWHSIYGEVTFVSINNDVTLIIKLIIGTDTICCSLAKDGHAEEGVGDCLLWPSKECRDWSKFKISKPKFDIRSLKPFDKVLVRDECENIWRCNFFSHHRKNSAYQFFCVDTAYKQCIPYNDETKYLIGTNNTPPEFYDKCWEITQ